MSDTQDTANNSQAKAPDAAKRPRIRIATRELSSLAETSGVSKSAPKCPICLQRIPPKHQQAHYDYEVARLNDPTSNAYTDPLSKTNGKRGAAVAARQHMEKKRKRPGSVYEERLDTIKQNAKRRSNVLKHLDAPARNSAGQQQEIDQAIFSQQGEQTCFVCNQVLFGDSDAINAHIDHCLENMNDPSSSFARQTTTPQSQPSLETASPAPQPGAWDVYEWDGEVRVRASAMMEGGYRGAGFATTKKEEDVDIDEDLDIEDDDNAYGQAQYTEQDIHIDDDDDDDAELSIDDDGDMPGASSSTSAPNPYPPTGNLVMDALRARIHQLEMATKSVQRCLICLEPYTKPVASVVCWHVHCEKCWMQTLSSKKLCPQCQKITAPADLRRVYL